MSCGYTSINGGSPELGMCYLMGGQFKVYTAVPSSPDEIWTRPLYAYTLHFPLTCWTYTKSDFTKVSAEEKLDEQYAGETVRDVGIVFHHGDAIIKAQENLGERTLLLQNPWCSLQYMTFSWRQEASSRHSQTPLPHSTPPPMLSTSSYSSLLTLQSRHTHSHNSE